MKDRGYYEGFGGAYLPEILSSGQLSFLMLCAPFRIYLRTNAH